jgi:hypothetical protein
MSPDPRELRGQAAALRRAADRLTILRLRVANTIAGLARAEDPATRGLGARIHARWTATEQPELGRIAGGLRSSAAVLEEVAVRVERRCGRRLGGYAGAGFLGRGDEALRHVEDVAGFVGTRHGASIGGFPLLPTGAEGLLAHPSHTLGIETPDYDEAD